MPIQPDNPSPPDSDLDQQGSPFTGATGTEPVSVNPGAPTPDSEAQGEDELANSAPPDSLGGLVDTEIASLENGT